MTHNEREAGFPRCNQMLQWTTGERAIHDAVQIVEAMGADVRLTDAVILLGKARDRVADFVDGVGNRDVPLTAESAEWHAVEQVCRIIGAVLDGDPGPHTFGSDKLTEVVARIVALRDRR